MTDVKRLAEKIAGVCSANWMKCKEIESLLSEAIQEARLEGFGDYETKIREYADNRAKCGEQAVRNAYTRAAEVARNYAGDCKHRGLIAAAIEKLRDTNGR
jgi:hypothetical protein